MRRFWVGVIGLMIGTLAFTSVAEATLRVQVVTVGIFGTAGHQLSVTDTTGGANNVTITQIDTQSGSRWLIGQGGSLDFDLRSGCSLGSSRKQAPGASASNVAPTAASCNRPADGDSVAVNLDGGLAADDDSLVVKGPAGTAASFPDRVGARGGLGNDSLGGGGAQDSLDGGPGNDALTGNDGPDALEGKDGNDVLNGNEGTDSVNGADGSDVSHGGPGDDSLFEANGGPSDLLSDLYDGGSGFDRLRYAGPRLVLLGRMDDGFAGHDTDLDGQVNPPLDHLTDIEQLSGGPADDALDASSDPRDGLVLDGFFGGDGVTGGAGDNTLVGGYGGDFLSGKGGADTLFGDNGADTMKGDGGNDLLDGKRGDTLDNPPAVDTFDCGTGASDRAILSLMDSLASVKGCETIEQSDVHERYHPRLGSGKGALRLAEHGTVGVRIACPRKQRRACQGHLTVALGEGGANQPARTAYSVRAGEAEIVPVRLSASEVSQIRAVGHPLAAFAIAQERSRIGKPKTTIQRLGVSA